MKGRELALIGMLLTITSIIISITIPEVRSFLGLKAKPIEIKISPSETQEARMNQESSTTSVDIKKREDEEIIQGKYSFASSEYLTVEKLQFYSSWDLKIMRNEIYARHGYIFNKSKDMINYFNRQNWYGVIPKVSSDDVYVYKNKFSDIERYNVELIRNIEKSKK